MFRLQKKQHVVTELSLSSAEDPSFMFFTEVINPNSSDDGHDALVEEEAEDRSYRMSSTKTTKPTATRFDRLCLFSSFQDNMHGSERICSLLNNCGSVFGAHLLELELHAYHLPPTEVSAVVYSLVSMLKVSRHSLQLLRLDHLRLSPEHAAPSIPALLEALGTLQCLRELKLDPLPSCLWNSSPYQMMLLESLQKLPDLKSISLSLESKPHLFSGHNDLSDDTNSRLQTEEYASTHLRINQMLSSLFQSLTLLRLSGETWTTESCHLWNEALSSSSCRLQLLDLSRSTFVGTSSSVSLVHGLKANSSLQNLDLTHVLFQDDPSSLPRSSWPKQFWESLVQVLESNNTTLQAILESSHVTSLSRSSSSLTSSGWCCSGTTLQTLLALNRSGIRGKGGMDNVNPSSARSHVFQRTSSYSPTITYQLVCDNLPSLFVVEQQESTQMIQEQKECI